MAVELLYEIEEQDLCKEVTFFDTVGAYHATTNPTGYGAPNLATSAITGATITVTPNGSTSGHVFAFTIAANVISAATVTNPAGTVTNILADLASTAFPFIENVNEFTITGEYLDFGTDAEITSDGYNIEYTVTDGTTEYITDQDHIIVCQVCCCVRNAAADLKDCGCDEQAEALNNAINSSIFLDAAIWATEAGEIDKAVANLAMAKKLCEGKCTNC